MRASRRFRLKYWVETVFDVSEALMGRKKVDSLHEE